MGTPNINTIIDWVRSEYPDLPRIQTTNCRRISGSRTWSQHAWSNAADIFVDKQTGDELSVKLRERFGEWIKVMLWWTKDHFDHIHLDTWPTGINTPPCAGGKLAVKHKDGTIGATFTDDIPKGGDEVSQALRHQVAEAIQKGWLGWPEEGTFWLELCEDPTNPQWRSDFEPMWNQRKAEEWQLIKAATSGVDQTARDEAKRANDRLSSLDTKLANIVI
jgi:hypothetical protein